MIYLDLDDFYDTNDSLATLLELKEAIPDFKVTLFTILGRCSTAFIDRIKIIKWVDLAAHGFLHKTNYECKEWDYARACSYLKWAERFDISKIFRAPGWQISDGCYRALLNNGWSVADQTYNNERRPKDLPVYLLDSPHKLHGHIGHIGGHNKNELTLMLPEILKHKEAQFGFVKDAICIPTTL